MAPNEENISLPAENQAPAPKAGKNAADKSKLNKIAHDNLRIVEDADRGRFDLWQDDQFIGFAGYELKDNVMVFQHTLVDEKFGRRGYARAMVTLVLESARSRGWKVLPVCSYVLDYLERYPEYKDLVVSSPNAGSDS
ncbi:GNAT family N-acetyltransferase [Micrococcoides hystricis]|uniref:GNAT family N-acetyltransferase n=1 Tax=Micrococcoides hystricis TaxID=1572761 RepID=A0ABV6P963_9MICC